LRRTNIARWQLKMLIEIKSGVAPSRKNHRTSGGLTSIKRNAQSPDMRVKRNGIICRSTQDQK
jgi:hypothetical protein